MYNRYVPQADGTFLRSQVPESVEENENPAPVLKESTKDSEDQKQDQLLLPKRSPSKDKNFQSKPNTGNRFRPNSGKQSTSTPTVSSFIKGLIPQNFDSEDLMVVLLLLLMSGGNNQDQNAALLTLCIYLFM